MQQIRELAVGVMVILGACTPFDDTEELELYEQELRSAALGGEVLPASAHTYGDGGGRTGGDWIVNGLSSPTVSGVDPAHSLGSSLGLGMNGWLGQGDLAGEDVIRYMVECALDVGDSVTVSDGTNSFTFDGMLGLAPEWKTQACNQDCQQWVSACLMARTNATGAEVQLFVQGDNPALGFGAAPSFPNYEATYFGNVFEDPAPMHACVGTVGGLVAADQHGRTCALNEDECGFTIHQDCVVDAGCGTSATGVATIGCQPEPSLPSFHGISVNVGNPGGGPS